MARVNPKTEAQFVELFNTHLSAVVNFAARRASRNDAIDIAAETFAIAWRRLDEVPAENTLPWLYEVARRVLSNQRRGTLRRSSLHDKLCAEWIPQLALIPESAEYSPAYDALRTLSDDDQELLLLSGIEELRPAEIAVVLNLSPAVVRNRLSRARSRLRDAMNRVEGRQTT